MCGKLPKLSSKCSVYLLASMLHVFGEEEKNNSSKFFIFPGVRLNVSFLEAYLYSMGFYFFYYFMTHYMHVIQREREKKENIFSPKNQCNIYLSCD